MSELWPEPPTRREEQERDRLRGAAEAKTRQSTLRLAAELAVELSAHNVPPDTELREEVMKWRYVRKRFTYSYPVIAQGWLIGVSHKVTPFAPKVGAPYSMSVTIGHALTESGDIHYFEASNERLMSADGLHLVNSGYKVDETSVNAHYRSGDGEDYDQVMQSEIEDLRSRLLG